MLLELHSGGGNNTVAVAPSFGEVRCVEINRILAEAAEANLRRNKIAPLKANEKILRLKRSKEIKEPQLERLKSYSDLLKIYF